MAPFPKTDIEREALWSFLSAPDAADPKVRAAAERLLARLEGPVRVALVGDSGSGKSSLTRLLVGRDLIPDGVSGANAPSVVAVHGKAPAIVAGWWSGRRKPYPIDALNAALSERSDYVEFCFPLPILEQISFFDMPAATDPVEQKKRLAWLLKRADLVLWCKKAGEAWTKADTELWSLASPQLRGASLLIVTGMDRMSHDKAQAAYERMEAEAEGQFAAVLPIATLEAIKSAPGGVIKNAEVWRSSGGRSLIAGLIKLAGAVRLIGATAARELLKGQGVTLAAPAPLPVAQPERALTGTDLRKALHARLDELIGMAEDQFPQQVGAFFALCATTLAELQEYAAHEGLVDPSAAWLSVQIAEASRRLAAVSEDPSANDARDSASILLQLARDISWSVAA